MNNTIIIIVGIVFVYLYVYGAATTANERFVTGYNDYQVPENKGNVYQSDLTKFYNKTYDIQKRIRVRMGAVVDATNYKFYNWLVKMPIDTALKDFIQRFLNDNYNNVTLYGDLGSTKINVVDDTVYLVCNASVSSKTFVSTLVFHIKVSNCKALVDFLDSVNSEFVKTPVLDMTPFVYTVIDVSPITYTGNTINGIDPLIPRFHTFGNRMGLSAPFR